MKRFSHGRDLLRFSHLFFIFWAESGILLLFEKFKKKVLGHRPSIPPGSAKLSESPLCLMVRKRHFLTSERMEWTLHYKNDRWGFDVWVGVCVTDGICKIIVDFDISMCTVMDVQTTITYND